MTHPLPMICADYTSSGYRGEWIVRQRSAAVSQTGRSTENNQRRPHTGERQENSRRRCKAQIGTHLLRELCVLCVRIPEIRFRGGRKNQTDSKGATCCQMAAATVSMFAVASMVLMRAGSALAMA